jgi:hypothetical protein
MTLFWPELHRKEREEQASDLEEWVAWLRSVDRRTDEVLKECWVYHPGVVLQLAAWQGWWWEVYAPSVQMRNGELEGGTQSGYQAIAWWQSLEQAQARLASELRGCQAKECSRKPRLQPRNGSVRVPLNELVEANPERYFPLWAKE